VKEKSLDKLAYKEIKAIIEKNEITLNELDNDTLTQLMNYEIDMICIGEGDMDFISLCADILNERENPILSKEEFSDIIEKTRNENVIIKPNEKNITLHKALKRTLIIIAATFIILSSTIGIAYAFNFDILRCISDIVRQPEGSKNTTNGYTFYHNEETQKYDSIEIMMENEDFDIMYPTKWPDGIEVECVLIGKEVNGNDTISIATNDPNVNICIEFSDTFYPSSMDEFVERNGIRFYFEDRGVHFGIAFHKNKRYYISAKTREDLLLIIENLKE